MNFLVAICFTCLFFKTDGAFAPSTNLFREVDHRPVPQCHVLFATKSLSDNDDMREIQDAVGLTDAELKRIVSRVPQINEYSAAEAKICMSKLKDRLALSDVEFKKKIVLRLPQCLGYNFDSDIDPSLAILQDELKMTDGELKSLVLKCPQIIGLDYSNDVKQKIKAVVDEQDFDAGDNGIAEAKATILDKPAVLNLPVRGGASKTLT